MIRRTPNEKFLLLFESVKRSLLATEALFVRIDKELGRLESEINLSNDIEKHAVPAILDVVSFVDFANRFGTLVAALPTINHKKSTELRDLALKLKVVEEIRNHLQHLRDANRLMSHENINYPILGTLSWSREATCYWFHLSQASEIESCSIAYDRQENRWVSQYQYAIRDHVIDLEIVLEAMRRAFRHIVSVAPISDPKILDLTWGSTMMYRAKFDKTPELPIE